MTPKPIQERDIYFVPSRRHADHYYLQGLTWKVWAQGASFYFISRHEMNDRKISLHGPTERHPNTSWFKLALDRSSGDSVVPTKLLPYGDQTDQPLSFPGRQVKKGVKHVVRFRWTSDLFQIGAPPSHEPGKVKPSKSQVAAKLPAPLPGYALDVDFFLSEDAPYIPRSTRARRDNAVLGPQMNRLGQALTAVVYTNDLKRHPTPEQLGGLQLPAMTAIWECRRVMQAVRDPRGYLHMQERLIPREPTPSNENAG